MASGSLPTYSYVPAQQTAEPNIRTCSNLRSRLTAGGTYFRARDVGLKGNLLSVGVYQEDGVGYCVVTNQNVLISENVLGPVTTSYLTLKNSSYADLWEVSDLMSTPRAKYYSISLRIAFARQADQTQLPSTFTDLGTFRYSSIFSASGKLAVQLSKNTSGITQNSVVFIQQRFKIYRLLELTATDPVTSQPVVGYDIANLRAQINASDPWIEMPERGYDVQDTIAADAQVLSTFNAQNLIGGNGLPDAPYREQTGSTRSLIFVNYGENKNGALQTVSTIYEWAGDSATSGAWKAY